MTPFAEDLKVPATFMFRFVSIGVICDNGWDCVADSATGDKITTVDSRQSNKSDEDLYS